ncbi:MAG TPA: PAS domain S-box protein [Chloroflexia bacterium]|nr:PAS domain S-box protein [Chloroflexia bacterium]
MQDKDLQHLAAIVRDSDDAIIGKTLAGIITSWNRGAEQIYGYTAAETIGRSIALLVPPDREDELPKILKKLTAGEGISHYATLRVTKDGRLVNIALTISPIRDAAGAITGISSIGRDVTREKEAEDALRESARAYQLLMEQASEAILVSYPNQPLIAVNQRASDMLGYTREELLQPPQVDSPLPASYDLLPPRLDEILVGDIVYAERPVRRKDGTVIVTELSTRRLDDGRIVTIARDITGRKHTEQMLRERDLQLSEAQELAHVGSWETDVVTGEAVWSDEMYRIFGVAPQSHPASFARFMGYVHPDDRERVGKETERAHSQGGTFGIDYQVLLPDGAVRALSTRGRVILDESGKPQRIVGTGQDVTERVQAEDALRESAALYRSHATIVEVRQLEQAALRESEALYRSLIDISPDGIVLTDLAGTIELCNQSAARLHGFTNKEELIGRSVFEFVAPEGQQHFAANIQALMGRGTMLDGEHAMLTQEGRPFPAELRTVLLRSPDGQPRGILAVVRDVTARKRAEETLRKSEGLYRALARNLPDGSVFMFDADLRYQLAEGPTLEAQGYAKHLIEGKTIWEVMTPADCERSLPLYRAALAGQEHRLEGEFAGRVYRTHFLPVKNEAGEIFAGMIVSQDITAQRHAEAARRAGEAAEAANHAKSAFLSRMSHELRTPLNAVLGFAQILEMDSPTPAQRESTSYILKAGRHLLNLINEVLDIARIEEGQLSISVEPVFLDDVLHESLSLVQPLTALRQISLQADLDGLGGCYIMADRQRLQQVLLNLLANAIKYNRPGGAVYLSCRESPAARSDAGGPAPAMLRITVRDSGPGLTPAQLARLFTPFERLGAEQTTVEGTGLGLALSKHLVEAMGGTIGVASEVGLGSTFWVELAQAVAPAAPPEPEAGGPQIARPSGAPARTVLYIEDNPSNCQLITRVLQHRPEVQLLTATQGRSGLDLAAAQHPDLILLDLNLPDMPGQEVLRQLRADPSTAAIPVLVLSADANPRQIAAVLAIGARAYLTKPLDVQHFLQICEESLV